MLDGENICQLTIDNIAKDGEKTIRKIQYSTINNQDILASFTTSIVTNKGNSSTEAKGMQTLQIYSLFHMEKMLRKRRFVIVDSLNMDGTNFHDKETKHRLIVAQKKENFHA